MTRRPESLAGALALVRGRPELGALRRGIEKESLRVTPTGALAATPHPRGLGSPLTHPHITTDFSEAQLELITGGPRQCRGRSCRACGDPSFRTRQYRGRTALGGEHAVHPWPRGRDSRRPVRLVQCRPLEERLSHGLELPVWAADADHQRHSLQLLGSRGADVRARPWPRSGRGFRDREVLRP